MITVHSMLNAHTRDRSRLAMLALYRMETVGSEYYFALQSKHILLHCVLFYLIDLRSSYACITTMIIRLATGIHKKDSLILVRDTVRYVIDKSVKLEFLFTTAAYLSRFLWHIFTRLSTFLTSETSLQNNDYKRIVI